MSTLNSIFVPQIPSFLCDPFTPEMLCLMQNTKSPLQTRCPGQTGWLSSRVLGLTTHSSLTRTPHPQSSSYPGLRNQPPPPPWRDYYITTLSLADQIINSFWLIRLASIYHLRTSVSVFITNILLTTVMLVKVFISRLTGISNCFLNICNFRNENDTLYYVHIKFLFKNF